MGTFLTDDKKLKKLVKKQKKKNSNSKPSGGGSSGNTGNYSQYSVANDRVVTNAQRKAQQGQQATSRASQGYLDKSLAQQRAKAANSAAKKYSTQNQKGGSQYSVANASNLEKQRQQNEENKASASKRLADFTSQKESEKKTSANRFLSNANEIGVEKKNDRMSNLTAGTLKQIGGGYATSFGHDSNEANEFKSNLDNMLTQGKIDQKTYDTNMAAYKRSSTKSKKYEGWEDTKAHKNFQKLEAKGQELQVKGDTQVNKGMENLTGIKKTAAEAYTSGLGMATDMALGPLWFGGMAARTYGNSLNSVNQMVEDGVITKKEADNYAGLQALKEVGTEGMFKGVGLAGKLTGAGKLTEKLGLMKDLGIDKLTANISNSVLKNVAGSAFRIGAGAAEEATEELAGGILDAPITNLAYANRLDKNYREGLQANSSDLATQRDSLLKYGYTKDEATQVMLDSINNEDFINNLAQGYIENGLSKKQAANQAKLMSEYFAADLSGDNKTKASLENQMAEGIKQKFSMSDTLGAMASAGLITAVTGLGSAINTNQAGTNIKNYYGEANGSENAASAITRIAKGLDDTAMSARASAMSKYAESGKDLSNEQYFELQNAINTQFNSNTQNAIASSNTGKKIAQNEKYIASATSSRTNDGKVVFGTPVQRTDANGNVSVEFAEGGVTNNRAKSMRNSLLELANQQEQAFGQLEDKDAVIEEIVAVENGAITPDTVEYFTDAFPENRALYESFTGLTLPKDNTAMRDFLFKRSADNYVQSAKMETIEKIDSDKGQYDVALANSFGGEGQHTLQALTNNIGVADGGTYIAYASVLGKAYDAGTKQIGFDNVKSLAEVYAIDEADVKAMYEAGLTDGKSGSIRPTVRYDVADPRKVKNSDRDTLLAFAGVFGRNIVVTDSLTVDKANNITQNKSIEESDTTGSQVNGMFYNNTIYINLSDDVTTPIGYTIMHELTHSLKKQFPSEYSAFAELYKQRWIEKNGQESFDNAIADKIALYEKNGAAFNKGREKVEALEEIICDQMGEVLHDEDFINNVAEERPDIARALLNSIRDILRKIRKLFAEYGGFPSKYNNATLSQLDMLKEAEVILASAIKSAQEARVEEVLEGETRFDIKQDTTITYDSLIAKPDVEVVRMGKVDFSKLSRKEIELNKSARLSLSSPVEETKDLIAVHNESENNLISTMELGGFPMASIAVTKSDFGHSDFGDISVLFDKDTIDPQKNSNNKIYDRDAWTPTFPTVDLKINDKVLGKVEKTIKEILGNEYFAHGNIGLDSINATDSINRFGDAFTSYEDKEGMRYAYVKSVEPDYKYPTKATRLSKEHPDEVFSYVANHVDKSVLETIASSKPNELLDVKADEARVLIDAMNKYYSNEFDGLVYFEKTFPENHLDGIKIINISNNALTMMNGHERKEVYDDDAFKEYFDNEVNQKAYKEWLNNLFEGIVEKKGIHNGKEYLTPAGNRRTFEQLHMDYNLDNIVKAMKSDKETGGAFIVTGLSTIRGAAAESYKTIEDVKKNSSKIQKLNEEEQKTYDERWSELETSYMNVISSMAGNSDDTVRHLTRMDDCGEIIADSLRTSKTKSDFVAKLQKECKGLYTVNETIINDILDIAAEIKSMPVEYFEAKPRRVIELNEIKAVLIPDTTSDKLISLLDQNNVPYYSYKSGDMADRTKVLNEVADNENLKFSLPEQDSEGNTLSNEQRMFFNDSKICDESGNLQVVYHGTSEKFTVFDRTKSRANMDIQGNFFSPWELDSKGYGENVNAYYLNIKNPASEGVAYSALNKFAGQNNAGILAREYLESKGFDGVNNESEEFIAFYPEQIKKVDNTEPTDNEDIRFSIRPDLKDDLELVLEDKFNKASGEVVIGNTSDFLTSVIGIEPNIVTMPAHKAYFAMVTAEEALKYRSTKFKRQLKSLSKEGVEDKCHGLGVKGLNKALIAAEKPIIAFSSDVDYETGEPREDRIVLVTNEKDSSGNYVVVVQGVSLNTILNGIWVESDKIITAFGKRTLSYQIEKAVNEDRILFVDKDKKRSQNVIGSTEHQSLSSRNIDFNQNIQRFLDNVNYKKNKDNIKMTTETNEGELSVFGKKLQKALSEVVPTEDEVLKFSMDNDLYDPLLDGDISDEAKSRRVKVRCELLALVEDISRNETKLTHELILDEKTVKSRIKELMEETTANSDILPREKRELTDYVLEESKSVWQIVKNTKMLTESTDEQKVAVRDYIFDIAHNVIGDINYIDSSILRDYKDMRDYFKTAKIKITDDLKGDLDWTSFRRKNFGRMNLVGENYKGVAVPVDEIWEEIIPYISSFTDSEYGDLYELGNPADMLLAIDSALDNTSAYRDLYASDCAQDIERQFAQDLLVLIGSNGKAWESFADKKKKQYDERTKQLKQRHKEALRDMNLKYKEKLSEQKAKSKESLEKRLEKEKSRSEKKLQTEKTKQKEQKAKKKSAQERMKSWGNIESNYVWLTKRLLNPKKEDGQNIPEALRRPLASALELLDLQTERSAKLEESREHTSKATQALRHLKDEISKVADEENGEDFIIHPVFFSTVDSLIESLDNRSLRELTNNDLSDIDDMLAMIRHTISQQHKLFVQGKQEAVTSAGEQAIADMDEKVAKYGKGYTYTGIKGGLRHIFNEDMMTPIDFFESLGGQLQSMYKNLRYAQDEYIAKIKEMSDFATEAFAKFTKAKKPGSAMEEWSTSKGAKTFTLTNGEQVTLSASQMMSLYCMSKREQALSHILGSGIVISEITPYKKLDKVLGGKAQNTVAAVRLNYGDVLDIIDELTDEQRQVADALQGQMNGTIKDWGNETSMQLYGIKLFKEENYFPINVEGAYLDGKIGEDSGINGNKITSFGFTKPITQYASNPIIVGDIFDIFSEHANKMALFSSYSAALLDFNRVYNYKHKNEESGLVEASVKQKIEDAFGNRSIAFIRNLLDDINGQATIRNDGISQAINSALARYKKAAIGLNLRVLVQQPTAIVRSLYYLSPKYFSPSAFAGIGKNQKEMHEHCPIAYWKAVGNYQNDYTRGLKDQMFNKWSKYDAITMGIYGFADDMTWAVIWGAVKNEVKDKHPKIEVGSEAFWVLCNERASEVFDKTQVVDSVFHRSDAMRSRNGLTKVATSFMAEPTRTYNMARSSIVRARRMAQEGNTQGAVAELTKTAVVLVLNAAAVSAAAAVIDALRGKGDDDDIEAWYETFLKNFWENFIDNASLLNQVVWIKDISQLLVNAWQGKNYGTSNMALEGWNKLGLGIAEIQKVYSGEMSFMEWVEKGNFTGGIGYVTGVPIYNIQRDLTSIWDKLGLPAFASDEKSVTAEEKVSLLDYERNPLQIEDGTWGDKVLNKFGINLTSKERSQKEYEKTLKDIESKTKKLSGNEKKDRVNELVMDGYTKKVERADTVELERMRKVIKAAGGDVEDFDTKVSKKMATAYKKTIGGTSEEDIKSQSKMKDYLLGHGWTQADISAQIVYYSDSSKDYKAAARMMDYDAMVDALVPLIQAGLTEADCYKLYTNRNRGSFDTSSTGTLATPVAGDITSGYGYRNSPTAGASSYHEGIDIGAALGSVVGSADGGEVVYAGYNSGYGNQVIIQHDNGTQTYYSHLDYISVKRGQNVSQKQYIGNVGSTGTSTGPHLDFRVKVNGSFVDPMSYLKA